MNVLRISVPVMKTLIARIITVLTLVRARRDLLEMGEFVKVNMLAKHVFLSLYRDLRMAYDTHPTCVVSKIKTSSLSILITKHSDYCQFANVNATYLDSAICLFFTSLSLLQSHKPSLCNIHPLLDYLY